MLQPPSPLRFVETINVLDLSKVVRPRCFLKEWAARGSIHWFPSEQISARIPIWGAHFLVGFFCEGFFHLHLTSQVENEKKQGVRMYRYYKAAPQWSHQPNWLSRNCGAGCHHCGCPCSSSCQANPGEATLSCGQKLKFLLMNTEIESLSYF